ncbi:CaiB/BaiF CoA transferase family protein [Streptomyces brasiliensis]|uniref:CoA transferase n=1 Tax=Streptomyces brasiliensis TaxID=1954 RepID=A0A917KEZ1_9ACTN|nr:CoA transferase [Streptomyces brasiliensis]GGJ08070.1 CoA transferase [Streptomyces brasiliensis]
MPLDSLRGVRVIDFTHIVAGPVCTMTLADLGADVVKIEPLRGEAGRRIGPPWVNGESVIALSVNRNKRSLAVDLKSAEGVEAVRKMIRHADVVVESFRPGVMSKLQLDYESLLSENPDVVYCSISAFGQSGSLRDRPGVDGVMQAVSGLMSTLGEPTSGPSKVQIPVADMVTGYLATISILSALHQAREGRGGQHLDVSLFNATLMLQQIGYASFFATGNNAEKIGSAAPYAAPNEAFPTKDGWIMVAAYDPKRWPVLCELLGVPELALDPRFSSNAERITHRSSLRDVLGRVFETRPTGEWLELLSAGDILSAPVTTYSDVVASPAYRESRIDSCFEHPVAGSVRVPGFVLGPSQQPAARLDAPPPLIGEHSLDVLTEYGFEPQELAGLVENGIVTQSPDVPSTAADDGRSQ